MNGRDQRGYPRPGLGAVSCSIGAYEYNAQAPLCVGDCSGDGRVTIVDIIRLVDIALGHADPSKGDPNRDGEITIDEIVAAVNSALTGCSAG